MMHNLCCSRFHFCTRKPCILCGNKHVHDHLWLAKHGFKHTFHRVLKPNNLTSSQSGEIRCENLLWGPGTYTGISFSDIWQIWTLLLQLLIKRVLQKELAVHSLSVLLHENKQRCGKILCSGLIKCTLANMVVVCRVHPKKHQEHRLFPQTNTGYPLPQENFLNTISWQHELEVPQCYTLILGYSTMTIQRPTPRAAGFNSWADCVLCSTEIPVAGTSYSCCHKTIHLTN